MAKKSANSEPPIQADQPLANVTTTDLEVPQTMHIESTGPKEVPPDTNGEKPEIFDPNKEIMDAIYAKRRKQLEAESVIQSGLESVEPATDDDEIPAEEPPSPAVKAVAQEPPVVSSPQVVQQTVAPAAGTPPEKVKIKVEGQELDVPFDTLVTLAQKGLSAEQRWQEAAAMKQQAQQLMTNQQDTPAKPNTPSEILPKEKLADIVKRINYGSEEEQAKALLEYGAAIEAKVRDDTKPLPPEQLVQAATQNAVSQIRFEQDQATIAKEFPEVFKDEGLSLLAGNLAGKKVQYAKETGQFRPLIDIWRESLSEVKTRYMPSVTPPNPDTATPVQAVKISDDKIERKRAAPKPPAAANRVAAETPPQSGVNLGSIVNQMRKARGQPVY